MHAYITVDYNGRLTAASTITIGDITEVIPERVDVGGRAAPARIGAAMKSLGFVADGVPESRTFGLIVVPIKPAA